MDDVIVGLLKHPDRYPGLPAHVLVSEDGQRALISDRNHKLLPNWHWPFHREQIESIPGIDIRQVKR